MKIRISIVCFEQLVGAGNLGAKDKSIIDRCTADTYRDYIRSSYTKEVPTLKDLYRQLMLQEEPEARALALSAELFTSGSLNTFAHKTNVDTKNRIMDYDIRELGSQLMPLGMLVTLDAIFNRVIQNWKKGNGPGSFVMSLSVIPLSIQCRIFISYGSVSESIMGS